MTPKGFRVTNVKEPSYDATFSSSFSVAVDGNVNKPLHQESVGYNAATMQECSCPSNSVQEKSY